MTVKKLISLFLIIFIPAISTQLFGQQLKSIIGWVKNSDITEADSVKYYEKHFRQDGKVLSEAEPLFYQSIEYQYDEKGRLSKIEALHGESFTNGLTSFTYEGNKTIRKELALGYYAETIKTVNDSGKVIQEESFYGGGSEDRNFLSKITFYYNDKQQLIKKEEARTDYETKIERGDLMALNTGEIKKTILQSPSKQIHLTTNYHYTKFDSLRRTTTFDTESGQIVHRKIVQYDAASRKKVKETNLDEKPEIIYLETLKYDDQNRLELHEKKAGLQLTRKKYSYAAETRYQVKESMIYDEEDEPYYSIKYFEKDKLLRTEQYRGDDEMMEAIWYEYVYW